MKKILALVVMVLLLSVQVCFAAGTFTKKVEKIGDSIVITLLCTGDSSNGSLASTTIADDGNWYYVGKKLISVRAFPTADGTTPESATNIFINDENGNDILDAKGANLVPTSGENRTVAYSTHNGLYEYYTVIGTLSLVGGNGTVLQNYTIKLIFE